VFVPLPRRSLQRVWVAAPKDAERLIALSDDELVIFSSGGEPGQEIDTLSPASWHTRSRARCPAKTRVPAGRKAGEGNVEIHRSPWSDEGARKAPNSTD